MSGEQIRLERVAFGLYKMSAISERDQALSILGLNLNSLNKLYKECFLSRGKGALLVYTEDVIDGRFPTKGSYRTKREMLEIFDKPDSHAQLEEMIDTYEPKNEGVMTLITNYLNASFMLTCKF